MGLFSKNQVLTPEERRAQTIKLIKKQGIAYHPNLPLLEPGNNIKLKSPEEVRKRALGCMLCIQLACSIKNGENYAESLKFVTDKMLEWKLTAADLLPKERLLIQNKYTIKDCEDVFTQQDIVDVAWNYEAFWALAWALKKVSDKRMKNARKICDVEAAMYFAVFISEEVPQMLSVERILDMLDLFYCYHWACVEKRLHPETAIGKLNPEVVWERRKGLEWLISEETDWDELSLDT